MEFKLLAPKNDIRALKVQAVASFCNVKLTIPPFELGKDDKNADFLEKSPMGRLPVLVTPNGNLFESNAISKYLCSLRREHNLLGNGIYEEALVNMWLDFNTYELEIPICCCLISNKYSEKNFKHINETFKCLNNHLLYNQFMVGNSITIADICICVILSFALKSNKLEESLIKKYTNLYRLFNTISNQKQFKYVFANTATVKKVTSGATTTNKEKVVKKNDNIKNKSDSNKKKEKKEEVLINGFIEDGLEEEEEKKKKKVNPLDLLPVSTFSLDDWKYKFSNEKESLKNVMPYFWNQYDKNGFSLYYMKYDKLEDECQISFVASNMASGFLQRLDNNFSKYSFAVVSVLGENKNFDIEGVWLFRGTDIPFEMKDHPSFEYHIFKKLDADNADDKKLVEEYWCEKETIANRPVVDKKVWK
ncbi:elongation factor 1-gamma, putative [Hepatocystis sp. ex Piliocolobus tephrosceles]|nr:elongation factor 1-gamma, putative [Hepatocystis sp. ex Piliocolobus tephrosceles]